VRRQKCGAATCAARTILGRTRRCGTRRSAAGRLVFAPEMNGAADRAPPLEDPGSRRCEGGPAYISGARSYRLSIISSQAGPHGRAPLRSRGRTQPNRMH
jgi:hypothetical protein